MTLLSKLISTEEMMIEFVMSEGLKGIISPVLWDEEINTGDWIWIQNFYGPFPVFKIYGSPHETVPCLQVQKIEQVQELVNSLWEKWSESFYSRNAITKKTVWIQGNDCHDKIMELLTSKIFTEISWQKLCEFSRYFTNRIPEDIADPSLVYLDNSGGFKSRGIFLNEFHFNSIRSQGESNLLSFNPLSIESVDAIDNGFGAWEGYPYQDNLLVYFSSCNGNTMVALAESEHRIRCLFSTRECNYYRFFLREN